MTHGDPDELARQRAANLASYLDAAAPVLTDLALAGCDVATIGELRQRGPAATAAVPILVHWLPRVTDTAVKADIVRALGGGSWAKAAAPALIEEFRRAPAGDGPGRRWQIGEALASAATDEVFDDIMALARERGYGRDREMVVLALGNMRNPRAVDVLLELARDDEVAGQAATALGVLRAEQARPILTELAGHPKTWVRKEAEKALRRLDRRR
jgi:hypothetical protein